jgi:hypothetical protein
MEDLVEKLKLIDYEQHFPHAKRYCPLFLFLGFFCRLVKPVFLFFLPSVRSDNLWIGYTSPFKAKPPSSSLISRI